MFIGIISITGLLLGILIANYTKEELKTGQKYFLLIEITILTIIFFTTLRYNTSIILLIVGVLLGLIIRDTFLFLAVLVTNTSSLQFLNTVLTFIYGITEGSTLYYTKNNKKVFISLGLFLIPFILYLFHITLIPILNGGIIGVTLYKVYDKLLKKKKLQ